MTLTLAPSMTLTHILRTTVSVTATVSALLTVTPTGTVTVTLGEESVLYSWGASADAEVQPGQLGRGTSTSLQGSTSLPTFIHDTNYPQLNYERFPNERLEQPICIYTGRHTSWPLPTSSILTLSHM